ncbi:MAG: hypothetical protein IJP27_03085 [Clostridia bacterium]|nr:hypothetical protein [Clostridia bacterium]
MLNFTQRLTREITQASRMTLPELDRALAAGEDQTVARLTALSLAKKAAEGGMDAIKLIRELTKGEPEKESGRLPTVEFRVIP